MTINERLKFLRKSVLDITQEEFAKKIDVSTSNIGGLEIGRTNLTERVIKSICTTFGVSEEWLRDGIGDPIADGEKHVLYQLKEYFDLEDIDIDIVMTYSRLPLKYRILFRQYIKLIVDHENNTYISDIENRLENEVSINSNFEQYETYAFNSDEQEKVALHEKLDEELAKEKKLESEVSSVKESDVG